MSTLPTSKSLTPDAPTNTPRYSVQAPLVPETVPSRANLSAPKDPPTSTPPQPNQPNSTTPKTSPSLDDPLLNNPLMIQLSTTPPRCQTDSHSSKTSLRISTSNSGGTTGCYRINLPEQTSPPPEKLMKTTIPHIPLCPRSHPPANARKKKSVSKTPPPNSSPRWTRIQSSWATPPAVQKPNWKYSSRSRRSRSKNWTNWVLPRRRSASSTRTRSKTYSKRTVLNRTRCWDCSRRTRDWRPVWPRRRGTGWTQPSSTKWRTRSLAWATSWSKSRGRRLHWRSSGNRRTSRFRLCWKRSRFSWTKSLFSRRTWGRWRIIRVTSDRIILILLIIMRIRQFHPQRVRMCWIILNQKEV